MKRCSRCMKVSINATEKYCDKCMIEYNKQQQESRKQYYKKGTYKQSHLYKMSHDEEYKEKVAFYKSDTWLQCRDRVLVRCKGIDLYDYYINGVFSLGRVVHHIVPRKEDKSRQYDVDNLIALTNTNHNKIHDMYKTDKENIQKMLFELLDRWDREMGKG